METSTKQQIRGVEIGGKVKGKLGRVPMSFIQIGEHLDAWNQIISYDSVSKGGDV